MVPEVPLIGCNPEGQSAPPVTESMDVNLTEDPYQLVSHPVGSPNPNAPLHLYLAPMQQEDLPSAAMLLQSELKGLADHKVYSLEPHPKGIKPVRVKWVLTFKPKTNARPTIYKVQLVAGGNTEYKVPYAMISSLVVTMTSIHVILMLAASLGLVLLQADATQVFLNSFLV
eukprot:Ihof_evm1s1316 gene=Ihof_evmTU1s1316